MKKDMINTIESLPKTMVVVLGILGIELYGFSFTILLSVIFGFLCTIDTLLGYYIARRKQVVSSRTRQDGVVSKSIQFLILSGIILVSGHLAYSTNSEWVDALSSLLSIFAAAAFCTGQVVSILENLALITHGLEQGIIKFLIKVLLRIFGIGAERIEEKLKRYSLPLDTQGQKD